MGRPRITYANGLHTCSMCSATKPVAAFSYQNKARGKLQARCKECCSVEFRRYRLANPEKFREYKWHSRPENIERRREARRQRDLANPERAFARKRKSYLKKAFGISPEQYDEMLAEQGGVCAICGTSDPGRGGAYFHVDHCHTTSKIRGLLCNRCNAGLGYFKDDTSRLQSAVAYLEGHK